MYEKKQGMSVTLDIHDVKSETSSPTSLSAHRAGRLCNDLTLLVFPALSHSGPRGLQERKPCPTARKQRAATRNNGTARDKRRKRGRPRPRREVGRRRRRRLIQKNVSLKLTGSEDNHQLGHTGVTALVKIQPDSPGSGPSARTEFGSGLAARVAVCAGGAAARGSLV